jgi:hypothetical protein
MAGGWLRLGSKLAYQCEMKWRGIEGGILSLSATSMANQ